MSLCNSNLLISLSLLLLTISISPIHAARKLGDKVPDQFIITLNGDCTNKCRNALKKVLSSNSATKKCKLAPNAAKFRSTTFEIINCKGSKGEEANIASIILKASNKAGLIEVDDVEQDAVVTKFALTFRQAGMNAPTWGVDEVDGGGAAAQDNLRTCYQSSSKGAGVDIWVLDTGCSPSSDAECLGYFGSGCTDGDGHGTHVGGTAASLEWGVAPEAKLNCVKVLDDSGSGTNSDIIAGIEHVAGVQTSSGGNHVINLSLGGKKSKALNRAVISAAADGVYFAIAAGNEGALACRTSPASAKGDKIFTTQAHGQGGVAATFTNYASRGKDCTQVSAPGVDVESFGGVFSGTSMAAPHLAGAMATLLSDGRSVSVGTLTENGVEVVANGKKALGKPSVGLSCL